MFGTSVDDQTSFPTRYKSLTNNFPVLKTISEKSGCTGQGGDHLVVKGLVSLCSSEDFF
jgi:hypothetical protein